MVHTELGKLKHTLFWIHVDIDGVDDDVDHDNDYVYSGDAEWRVYYTLNSAI